MTQQNVKLAFVHELKKGDICSDEPCGQCYMILDVKDCGPHPLKSSSYRLVDGQEVYSVTILDDKGNKHTYRLFGQSIVYIASSIL